MQADQADPRDRRVDFHLLIAAALIPDDSCTRDIDKFTLCDAYSLQNSNGDFPVCDRGVPNDGNFAAYANPTDLPPGSTNRVTASLSTSSALYAPAPAPLHSVHIFQDESHHSSPVHELKLSDAYAFQDAKAGGHQSCDSKNCIDVHASNEIHGTGSRTDNIDLDANEGKELTKYKGVLFDKRDSKYRVTINSADTTYHLGSYHLKTDGAFVFDLAQKIIKGPSSMLNFQSEIDYLTARNRELIERGIYVNDDVPCLERDVEVKRILTQISLKQAGHDREPGKVTVKGATEDERSISNRSFNITNKDVSKNSDRNKADQSISRSTGYKGVSRDCQGKYRAVVYNKGKQYFMGGYLLEADASLAYDKGNEVFVHGPRTINFYTFDEYLKARNDELKSLRDQDEVSSVADIEIQINQRIIELQQPKAKPTFRGITKKTHRIWKYAAQINHNRRHYHLGNFQLASDAARCYDAAVKLLKQSTGKFNFESEAEYLEARELELKKQTDSEHEIESFEAVISRIKDSISAIQCKPDQESVGM